MYVSFVKTHLLIIVSGVVLDDWKPINKGVFVEKFNKCCIDIIKRTNNLRKDRKDDTYMNKTYIKRNTFSYYKLIRDIFKKSLQKTEQKSQLKIYNIFHRFLYRCNHIWGIVEYKILLCSY